MTGREMGALTHRLVKVDSGQGNGNVALARVQVPKTRAKSVRRLCTEVLAKIDLRWSWTVCCDRNIKRASSEVSIPRIRWLRSSRSRLVRPWAAANSPARSAGELSSKVTAMSRASGGRESSIRAARRVSQRSPPLHPSHWCVGIYTGLCGEQLPGDVVGARRNGRAVLIRRNERA